VYRLVVADSRSPRDGRFIESIGFYDPLPNPAVVSIDADRVQLWLRRGARPSDSARQLLVKEAYSPRVLSKSLPESKPQSPPPPPPLPSQLRTRLTLTPLTPLTPPTPPTAASTSRLSKSPWLRRRQDPPAQRTPQPSRRRSCARRRRR
jgi:small subunit ribosomal protein S16